jgi:plastocyanin domain-containing protein
MRSIVWGLAVLGLLAGCASGSRQGVVDNGRIAISVTEKGFEPATVTVPAGKPVTLVVTRTTTKTCATELVMASHGINQPLPLGQAVEITFTPDKPGELSYACAMNMYSGKIIVK